MVFFAVIEWFKDNKLRGINSRFSISIHPQLHPKNKGLKKVLPFSSPLVTLNYQKGYYEEEKFLSSISYTNKKTMPVTVI